MLSFQVTALYRLSLSLAIVSLVELSVALFSFVAVDALPLSFCGRKPVAPCVLELPSFFHSIDLFLYNSYLCHNAFLFIIPIHTLGHGTRIRMLEPSNSHTGTIVAKFNLSPLFSIDTAISWYIMHRDVEA